MGTIGYANLCVLLAAKRSLGDSAHRAAVWAKKALGKAIPHGIPKAEWSHRTQHSKSLPLLRNLPCPQRPPCYILASQVLRMISCSTLNATLSHFNWYPCYCLQSCQRSF